MSLFVRVSFSLGVAGLQWKHHFGSSVSVTLNDNSAENCAEIMNHVKLNGMATVDDVSGSSEQEVQVSCQDANVILHQRQFHFMCVLCYVHCFNNNRDESVATYCCD